MIHDHRHGDILEIIIANPPVNALNTSVRQGLRQRIAQAQVDDSVTAVVIRGEGALFSGGADITEFGRADLPAALPTVVDEIEASIKPVIAAIGGLCLGGGLEVALACHYRVAVPSARLGLPEVKLGLVPGAGGTQRLPRLIGAEAALDLIVSGEPIEAGKARSLGLIDRIAEADKLPDEALALAREVAFKGARRTGERDATAAAGLFERFAADNARKIGGLDAPAACIEAVRAATKTPLQEGLAIESALFAALVDGEQSRALRHIFFAERAAAQIQGLPASASPRSVDRVGVIGAGTMGGGISMNFLSAGIPVTIVEMAQEPLDRGVATIRKNYDASAAKGRITPAQADRAMSFLTPTLDFEALSQCDLIIEAVYENIEIKRDIFSRLDKVARAGAILASNTSYLDVDEIAAATQRPQDVLGLHFFSPANVMRLLEVVRGKATAPDVLLTGMALAKRIKKTPVVAGVCYGFIGNRMLIPRQGNAIALVLEGATPAQVDRVHTAFGMPMGPFQMSDLAGVDIGWHRDPKRIESLPDALCAEGRWGQKTKAGYYDYDDGRRSSSSPVTQDIIDRFRGRIGISPRAVSDEEIVVRTLYTMVNEAAKILEEGIAQRPSDIDVVYVFGYGWPRHKGGPMFWADTIGLLAIVESLEHYRDRLGADFTISALLKDNAKAGRRFIGEQSA
jgi:3-hydroxyacyl-CoA dehydrogenase